MGAAGRTGNGTVLTGTAETVGYPAKKVNALQDILDIYKKYLRNLLDNSTFASQIEVPNFICHAFRSV